MIFLGMISKAQTAKTTEKNKHSKENQETSSDGRECLQSIHWIRD
jgi:hypothetical protein